MASVKRAGGETRLNKMNEGSVSSSCIKRRNRNEPKHQKQKAKGGTCFAHMKTVFEFPGLTTHVEGRLASTAPGAAGWCPGWRLRCLVKRNAKMARAWNPDKTAAEEQAELVERKLSVSVGTCMKME